MFTTMIRRLFQFLIVRAPRSRLAALGAMLVALCFARRLMRTAQQARPQADHQAGTPQESDSPRGRVIDGEYRRVDPRR